MVTWMKAKYSQPKTVGRYRSTHNMNRPRSRRKISNERIKQDIRASQPHVTLVVNVGGKRRFVRSYQ